MLNNSCQCLLLNDNLQELTLHNKHCYILGDLNLNTFGSVNNIGLKYLNMVKSNSCLSLITEPTRVTPTSATTIDHINQTKLVMR